MPTVYVYEVQEEKSLRRFRYTLELPEGVDNETAVELVKAGGGDCDAGFADYSGEPELGESSYRVELADDGHREDEAWDKAAQPFLDIDVTGESRDVALGGSIQPVLPEHALMARCPVHHTLGTFVITMGGVWLACGCEWRHGGGSLAGWFRVDDRRPAAEGGPA